MFMHLLLSLHWVSKANHGTRGQMCGAFIGSLLQVTKVESIKVNDLKTNGPYGPYDITCRPPIHYYVQYTVINKF